MVSKFLLWSKALLSGRMKHAMHTTAFPYSYPSLHLGRLASFWFFVEPLSVQTPSKQALYLGRLLFFFFLNYIKYIRLPGVEKEWPGFWKHEAGPFDSWLEFEAIYHLVLRSRRCSTGWLVCTVQIKNKEQDKHPCCLWISGVVVSLPKCQVCVYTYVCVCMWKLVLLKSEDVLTWCKSKQWRLGKKRKQKSEALF